MEIDLKAVQQRELEILKEVMALCERHGLRYFADSGTCLGAVRHQGFIPWDDDVDIGMPRKDFDKFRELARKELPEHLALLDFEERRPSTRLFIKIHDTRTTFVENYWKDFPEMHTGVYIDIFPYDGYPAFGLTRMVMRLKMEVFKRINWALRIPDSTVEELDPIRRAAVRFVRRRGLPFNWGTLRAEEVLRQYDVNRYPYVIENDAWIFPSACIRTLENRRFEDMEIPCPGDADLYLRTLFGDYMQFPPEEERIPQHGVAYFSMERSYLTRWWEKDEEDG